MAEAVNKGSLDVIDEIFAFDYIDLSALLGDVRREEYKWVFSNLRRAFPDARWTMDDLPADGDKVIGAGLSLGPMKADFTIFRPAEGRQCILSLLSTVLQMVKLLRMGIFSIPSVCGNS